MPWRDSRVCCVDRSFRRLFVHTLVPAAAFTALQLFSGAQAVEAWSGISTASDAIEAPNQTIAEGTKFIFTYWHYPGGPDPLLALNLETWRRHAPPGTAIVLVNESNIQAWVPDTPKEFFRLPYDAAKSDFVRASVLYHHGGIYMDSDFLVLHSLAPIFEKLDKGSDIVVYTDGEGESGECSASEGFSSNFIGARKGNPFNEVWWENVKLKLTRTCGEGEFKVDKVCCHEAFAQQPESRSCHIPWGHLEWLKRPVEDPDRQSVPKLDRAQSDSQNDLYMLKEEQEVLAAVQEGNRKSREWPPGIRMHCLRGLEGMAPHLNGEVYWQPWDPVAGATRLDVKGQKYDTRFDCKEGSDGDLSCKQGNWGTSKRTIRRMFDRPAYHLFFSTRKPLVSSMDEMFKESWLLAELYARSLGDSSKKVRSPSQAAAASPTSAAVLIRRAQF